MIKSDIGFDRDAIEVLSNPVGFNDRKVFIAVLRCSRLKCWDTLFSDNRILSDLTVGFDRIYSPGFITIGEFVFGQKHPYLLRFSHNLRFISI
jgi:hypothetical protein